MKKPCLLNTLRTLDDQIRRAYDYIMFSNIDLKLIAKLELDGRASFIELAQYLGVNPSTATKRFKALVNSDVVTIKAIPNPYKMGYVANALIAMNISMNHIDAVCKRLKEEMDVNQIVTTFGRFNLIVGIHNSRWEKLFDFISTHLTGAENINEIETFFVKGIYKRYYGPEFESSQGYSPADLDQIDHAIIRELVKDGRLSAVNLSNKLGISLSSASKRLTALLRDNVIHIRAITNPSKLGYHSNAYIFIRADHKKLDSICKKLYEYKQVSTLMTLMNGYDIYVSILARTPESLYDFIKTSIAPIPGVESMEAITRGYIVKRYYGSFHMDEESLSHLRETKGPHPLL